MNPNRKTLVAGAVMLALGLVGGWWAAQRPAAPAAEAAKPAVATASAVERRVLYWYDPMMPTQKFDQPGKSPFMDMQLVPRYADEGEAESPGVGVSAQAVQALGLRVATATQRAVATEVDAVGSVVLNERDVSIVQARANGFVERVYAHAPGDVVAAGAPIVDLLHPEWLAAQQEYLAVRATGDAALAAAARQRLVLLGMAPALIERVEQSGRAEAVTTVVAPTAGLVAELMVRSGMTVAAGMTLARLNGLSTMWVEAAVPEALAAGIVPGRRADVRTAAAPNEVLHGRVAAVLPEANKETRTLRVRIELPNPGGRLRAGQSVRVALPGATGRPAVVVPAEAVLRTGRRALVYVVDAPGRYRPVEVELGAEIGNDVVIEHGLDAGQQIVASGNFLLDSEASVLGVRAAPPASAPMTGMKP